MNNSSPQIILASTSPRRRQLLDQIGIRYKTADPATDESIRPGEAAREFVQRVALHKAHAVYATPANAGRLPVLAADTIVIHGDRIFGKPQNEQDGLNMLELLSDTSHDVITAIALVSNDCEQQAVSESRVTFRKTSADERVHYWQTREPRDKAGGYAIQGLGAIFIRSITGSYSGIMGLPLYETAKLLEKAGIRTI